MKWNLSKSQFMRFLPLILSMLLTIVCPLKSFAQTERTSAILFNLNWLLKGCGENHDFFVQKIEETIRQGMEELRKLNPEFEKLYKLAYAKKISIKCEQTLSSEHLAAFVEFEKTLRIGNKKIKTLGFESQLLLGKAEQICLLAKTYGNTNEDYFMEQIHSKINGDSFAYKFLKSKLEMQNCAQIIFHEFLHFMTADNLPREIHDFENRKYLENDPFLLTDVVYSCSKVAFRYGQSNEKNTHLSLVSPIYSLDRYSWLKSCETCGKATYDSKGKYLSEIKNEEKLMGIRNHCNILYDSIPQMQ